MGSVIDMIEEFKEKYEKYSNIKDKITSLTTEFDEIEDDKTNKIKLKTSFLLFIPLLSYIILIYMNNPTGGSTLLEMFMSSRSIPDSVYNRMSEIMYIVSFIYLISIFLKTFICKKITSKNIKKNIYILTEVDMIRFGNMFLCFLVSFFMSIEEANHDIVSIIFLSFMVFSTVETLIYLYIFKENKNKKTKMYNRTEMIKKYNKIKELEKEFEKEEILKNNLKNEILKKPSLMKKVIKNIKIEDFQNNKEDYQYELIKELKSKSSRKDKQRTEIEMINNAYKNIYNKDIENNFEIENF
jgi:hypothetical protein